MPIFHINKNSLIPIKAIPIKLEKDLQNLTENNIEVIFGLNFVASEYQLHGLRIDTLAFDNETRSFVIIEYKRDKSFSIIDQGYAYLALMLNHKADFILEYNEKTKGNLRREDVDWSQSRVLFVANSFTTYQQNAINFKDLPIELWEVKKYDNNTIFFDQLKSPDSKESIKTISKSKTIETVSQEIKKYSIEDHFKEGWEEGRELFDKLIERMSVIYGNIEVVPVKTYISIRLVDKSNFILAKARKIGLLIELLRVQPKDLKDPEKRTKYKNKSFEFYAKHVTEFIVNNEEDIEYALFLIKQVYDKFYK